MLKLERIESGFLARYPERIVTIDSHTQGEATRLLVGGIPPLHGASMQEKRDYFARHFDVIRRVLTHEPRGHRAIMAAVVTEPVSAQGKFGLLYMDAKRYPYLCGHATIGALVSLIETGALTAVEGDSLITVDTPSGPLDTQVRILNQRVESVAIDMVPSFVFASDQKLEVPGFGTVPVDLVCVGGFFAMVSAQAIGIELNAKNSWELIPLGMAIIAAANRMFKVFHPQRPEVNTVDVVEFYAEDEQPGSGKGCVIYGESHMDRSPCGTGTTAKLTLLHHLGKLAPGQIYCNTSPLGTMFEGRVVKTTKVGDFAGIIGQFRGNAQITGYQQFVVDAQDPFPQGFLL